MWIQAIAIILPRIQQHYTGEPTVGVLSYGVLNPLPPVPDSYIGTVSSSMFAGMMVGAIGWGTCKSIPMFIFCS
jgi:hypothetical protein